MRRELDPATVPSADVLWNRLRAFLGQWGEVDEGPRGLVLRWGDQVTEVEMTRVQLHEFVADFVRWRVERGLDDGLQNGLPLPLTDSWQDAFGPQTEPYARLALVGLAFEVVAHAP